MPFVGVLRGIMTLLESLFLDLWRPFQLPNPDSDAEAWRQFGLRIGLGPAWTAPIPVPHPLEMAGVYRGRPVGITVSVDLPPDPWRMNWDEFPRSEPIV
jgi:hypothetical protein